MFPQLSICHNGAGKNDYGNLWCDARNGSVSQHQLLQEYSQPLSRICGWGYRTASTSILRYFNSKYVPQDVAGDASTVPFQKDARLSYIGLRMIV